MIEELRARLASSLVQSAHRAPIPATRKTDEATRLLFRAPTTLFENLYYGAVYPFGYLSIYTLFSERLLYLAGFGTVHEKGLELLSDFGGEPFTLDTEHRTQIKGYFFDVATFQPNGLLEKCRERFIHEEKASAFFGLNREGTTLNAFFDLPELEQCNGKIKAAVFCIGRGNIYSVDPQGILMYLLRGISVSVFHYAGVLNSSGEANGLNTCLDGLAVTEWMQNRLRCRAEEMLVHGKSLGSSPALYIGTQMPNVRVVADRSFTRLSAVVNTMVGPIFGALLRSPIERFYPFPNEELIEKVEGPVLLIAAREDEMMVPEHRNRLYEALRRTKGESAEPLLIGPGRHSGRVWYHDGESQRVLTNFINK